MLINDDNYNNYIIIIIIIFKNSKFNSIIPFKNQN